MSKICYQAWRPRASALRIVDKANEIIEEFQGDGFDLTLRQLYYQFVSREWLANNQQEYKRLGDIVSRARRAGLISWDAIVDRTRMLRNFPSWDSPQDIISVCARQFKLSSAWEEQEWRVEVWFEKDALLGVFERACEEYRVPYFSCRGYTSDSETWAAAERLRNSDRRVLILHFGDHDPSGIDMSRDIEDRLRLFRADPDLVEVHRVALTMDQIEQYQPPPNPAKETDIRFKNYQKQFGNESWELDALNPRTLASLVRKGVESVLDFESWANCMQREENAREELELVAHRLPEMVNAANSGLLDAKPTKKAAKKSAAKKPAKTKAKKKR